MANEGAILSYYFWVLFIYQQFTIRFKCNSENMFKSCKNILLKTISYIFYYNKNQMRWGILESVYMDPTRHSYILDLLKVFQTSGKFICIASFVVKSTITGSFCDEIRLISQYICCKATDVDISRMIDWW